MEKQTETQPKPEKLGAVACNVVDLEYIRKLKTLPGCFLEDCNGDRPAA